MRRSGSRAARCGRPFPQDPSAPGTSQGSRSGRLGDRPSPLEAPVSRLRTHGIAYCLAHTASWRRAASQSARARRRTAPFPGRIAPSSASHGTRQSSVTGTPRTSQVRRATLRWPSADRCSRSALQARGSCRTRMDHRSTTSQPYASAMPRRCMSYAATRPRISRITGRLRGSKPVKMSTRQPAACRLATAASNCEASTSTSVPRRMSFPPAARLTRSGASSMARGTWSAMTWPSSFPRTARFA